MTRCVLYSFCVLITGCAVSHGNVYTNLGTRISYRNIKDKIKPSLDSIYLKEWQVKKWRTVYYSCDMLNNTFIVKTEPSRIKWKGWSIVIHTDTNMNVLKVISTFPGFD